MQRCRYPHRALACRRRLLLFDERFERTGSLEASDRSDALGQQACFRIDLLRGFDCRHCACDFTYRIQNSHGYHRIC